MTQVVLHIGGAPLAAQRVRHVLAAKRKGLARKGILVPRALPGPDGTWPRDALHSLAQAVADARPAKVILCSPGLAATADTDTIARLHAALAPLGPIRVVAHLDAPARMLADRYAAQVMAGRTCPLTQEIAVLAAPDRRAAAQATKGTRAVDAAPLWLGLAETVAAWEAAFGDVRLFSVDRDALLGEAAAEAVRAAFGIAQSLGKAAPALPAQPPSAATLTRARRFNAVLARYAALENLVLPAAAHAKFLSEMAVEGPPLGADALGPVTVALQGDIAALCAAHPGLSADHLDAPAGAADYAEADPGYGFRPVQYLTAFLPRIARAARPAREAPPEPADVTLSPAARAAMPAAARAKVRSLQGSPLAPHDDLPAPPDAPAFPATTPRGTGRTIVACMKNEGPYVLEWVAHHRALGFDRLLVYSNDCTDGTDALLDRLDALGLVSHRDNSGWQGRSPQTHALDRALEEPAVREATWVAHIDVDEFINVHVGDGTLDALFAAVPEATHIAMTWRLFGHGGVAAFEDRLVTEQFTRAAPRHLPKPHIAWGFKTLGRTIGYDKLSCHRPTRPRPDSADRVRWVNGSGAALPDGLRLRGWRSARDTVGYDLVQLNHYALRSADSFLIKRNRGRALHVDRTIGLNYWLRMDWSDHEDRSILRHVPRLRAARDAMLRDATLRRLHDHTVAWHRAQAAALRASPDGAALLAQALALDLTPTERAAWALSLDMES